MGWPFPPLLPTRAVGEVWRGRVPRLPLLAAFFPHLSFSWEVLPFSAPCHASVSLFSPTDQAFLHFGLVSSFSSSSLSTTLLCMLVPMSTFSSIDLGLEQSLAVSPSPGTKASPPTAGANGQDHGINLTPQVALGHLHSNGGVIGSSVRTVMREQSSAS